MNKPLDKISSHHNQMKEEFDEYIQSIRSGGSSWELRDLATFLREEIVPHAQGEEKHLYPEADELVRKHGRPTETMSIDHEWIESTIEEITDQLEEINSENQEIPQDLVDRLLGLKAVFGLHLRKEEEALVPILESNLSEKEQNEILDGLHEEFHGDTDDRSSSDNTTTKNVLDVRELPPKERHEQIFDRFEQLDPGASFVLVNDHDPKPLRYQFQAEQEGKFSWSYLKEGPDVWKVKLGKQINPDEQ